MSINLSILDKKLSILLTCLGIIGTFSGWKYGIEKKNLLEIEKGILGSAKVINAKLDYINKTSEQQSAWNEIWGRLLPICKRNSEGKLIEVKPNLASDAMANFYLKADHDPLKGTYNFSGYGTYTETIKDNSLKVPLLWGVKINSSESKTKEQIIAGTEIPIIITQTGQGDVIEFKGVLKTSKSGFVEEMIPIFYKNIQIVNLNILSGNDL